jgi:hypothetical protein
MRVWKKWREGNYAIEAALLEKRRGFAGFKTSNYFGSSGETEIWSR